MRDVNVLLAIRSWYDFELCECDHYDMFWKSDMGVKCNDCVWRLCWLGSRMCVMWTDASV